MSAEVIEYQRPQSFAPVTKQDLSTMQKHRLLLKEFIASQMKEANFSDSSAENYGEGDYGKIPGSKKKSLLKPGAEKLLKLFNLGVRVKLVEKEIDKDANFALFIYNAEVYQLRTNLVLAQCEGSTNSQENKYRERTVWKKRKLQNGKEVEESTKEETLVCDIINTLMKMAQKRAIIGATIIATAASDYFTQDMEIEVPPKAEVAASVPAKKTKAALPAVQSGAPLCCDKEMMISKYPDYATGEFPYYCTKCRSKVPSGIKAKA